MFVCGTIIVELLLIFRFLMKWQAGRSGSLTS